MTAPGHAPLERYDVTCAYCGDGKPHERRFAKAACKRCCKAFDEATGLSPTTARQCEDAPGLRRAVRDAMGIGSRHYIEPLYERATKARRSAG